MVFRGSPMTFSVEGVPEASAETSPAGGPLPATPGAEASGRPWWPLIPRPVAASSRFGPKGLLELTPRPLVARCRPSVATGPQGCFP